jgi:hypothetical protein
MDKPLEREALIDSGIPANMIDKFNATPNKLDASRVLEKKVVTLIKLVQNI